LETLKDVGKKGEYANDNRNGDDDDFPLVPLPEIIFFRAHNTPLKKDFSLLISTIL
jgi:hypothetical protein